MKIVKIYVLCDPRNDQVRYVGKTVQEASSRLLAHIRQAKRENKSYKGRWILQVLRAGFKPIIEVIESANEDNWQERERYWIVKYYEDGCKLTNETDGGEGLHGHKFSKEHRERIAQAQLGNERALGYRHTKEHKKWVKERMKGERNPNYGKTFSKEYRQKLGEARKGKKHAEKTKVKMSLSAKGNTNAVGHKQTEEHKRKLAAARNRTCIHCGKKIKRSERGSVIFMHRHSNLWKCDGVKTYAE